MERTEVLSGTAREGFAPQPGLLGSGDLPGPPPAPCPGSPLRRLGLVGGVGLFLLVRVEGPWRADVRRVGRRGGRGPHGGVVAHRGRAHPVPRAGDDPWDHDVSSGHHRRDHRHGGRARLFVTPLDRRGAVALDWATAARIPCGVLVLFGGGLPLAAAMDGHGVGRVDRRQRDRPRHGAGTSPDAIVFGSGYLRIGQMARAGVWVNLLAVVLATLAGAFVLPGLFGP